MTKDEIKEIWEGSKEDADLAGEDDVTFFAERIIMRERIEIAKILCIHCQSDNKPHPGKNGWEHDYERGIPRLYICRANNVLSREVIQDS